jgi:SAM-dependent methyltransferase
VNGRVDMGGSTTISRAQRRRDESWGLVYRHYPNARENHAYTRYETVLAEALAKAVPLSAGAPVVLDVGCGHGFLMAEFFLARGAEPHGLDPTIEAASCPAGVHAVRASAERIPYPDASFDLIACRSVIEHLERPASVFAEFSRVLRPDGRVVFLTANAYDYVSLVSRLVPQRLHPWLVGAAEGRQGWNIFPTFYRANSFRRLRRLAAAAGLTIEEIHRHHNYPAAFMFSPLLMRLAIAYDQLIQRFAWLHWLKGWILCTMRKSAPPASPAASPPELP